MKKNNPKISILIPVYNGAAYIEETINSIKNQNFTDYEIICINDCSTDNSLSILQKLKKNDPRILIYSTPCNFGIVPKVLNFAIEYISGDYFVYSSQDDLFSTDWLSSMYERAIETNADATIPDLIFYYGENSNRNKTLSGLHGDKTRVLEGREAFLHSLNWTIPGNALWKTWLIRKYKYFEFGMNADEYTARFYFLNCNKIVFSEGAFIYRQNNPSAITKSFSLKTFDIPYTDFMLWKLAKEHDFETNIQINLIKDSIRGLLYYFPYTFMDKYTSARPRLKRFFSEYKKYNVHEWLFKNRNNGLLVEKMATWSYSTFVFLSFLMLMAKKIRVLQR